MEPEPGARFRRVRQGVARFGRQPIPCARCGSAAAERAGTVLALRLLVTDGFSFKVAGGSVSRLPGEPDSGKLPACAGGKKVPIRAANVARGRGTRSAAKHV